MFDSTFEQPNPFQSPNPTNPYPSPPTPWYLQPRYQIAAAVAGILLIIALVWGIIAATSGDSEPAQRSAGDTPEQAVTYYFDALIKKDATTALAMGINQPIDREFLTPEILAKQQELAKISHFTITGTSPGDQPDTAKVAVSVQFGDVESQDTLLVRKTPSGYKLLHTVIIVHPNAPAGDARAMELLTLFGKPAGNGRSLAVFPGALEVGSSSQHVHLTAERNTQLLEQLALGSDPQWLVHATLADSVRQKVIDALFDKLDKCEHRPTLTEAGCPNNINNDRAAPNSAQWEETENYLDQDLQVTSNFATLSAQVIVTLHWSFSVKLADGGNGSGQFPNQPTDFTGSADLTKDPLEVLF